ncbi:formate dehydrogenase subunit delta [Insolitispirillum peregrinum]|uniref:formate dehydrogenase subunit delta n=1 Tax=Insolitispirillum peregrinum TaxID=80876 RepID=UPI00361A02C0
MKEQDMVRMANQIAAYFASYPARTGEQEVHNHIASFWEPRMRSHLRDYILQGGKGLHPLVVAAMAERNESVSLSRS